MSTNNSVPSEETPHSPTLIKHTTTNATPTNPFIDTTVLPINSNPVELDSTPVSPVSRKESWKIKGLAATGSTMVSPDLDEEAYGELSGEKGVNEVVRERRKQLLAERSKDPAVLIEPPQTPGAEEYEIAVKTAVVGTNEDTAATVISKSNDGVGVDLGARS